MFTNYRGVIQKVTIWSPCNIDLYRTLLYHASIKLDRFLFYQPGFLFCQQWFLFSFSMKHYIGILIRLKSLNKIWDQRNSEMIFKIIHEYLIFELTRTGLVTFRREGLQLISRTILLQDKRSKILVSIWY